MPYVACRRRDPATNSGERRILQGVRAMASAPSDASSLLVEFDHFDDVFPPDAAVVNRDIATVFTRPYAWVYVRN